jgi:molybdate transport system ATP-binding protein
MADLHLNFAIDRGGFRLAVDATIPLAGITAVFGPSGSGKTTLLRVIAGLERNAHGRVMFDGADWRNEHSFVPAHRRRIGYVFQDGRLFAHLTVEQNLAFAVDHARDAGPINLRDTIDALDLDDLLDRRPASLSGGEQQRAAIARALLTNPRLLLMDEPLSSLDTNRRREIAAYIERLPSRFGVPVLYVTHDIDEVIRLADHMLLLSLGRVVANAPVKDVLDRIDLWPLTGRLEAGSILEAVVDEHAEGLTRLILGDQSLRIPEIDAEAGKTIRLRVHARDVVIASRRPNHLSIRNVLNATLTRIDLDETIYAELLLSVGSQSLRARITREAVAELELESGQPVYALIKSIAFDDDLLR